MFPPIPLAPSALLDLLRSAACFRGIPQKAVDPALTGLKVTQYPADQVLLREKDRGEWVGIILKGWVKVRTHNGEGKEITLNLLGPGEMFGEMALVDQAPRCADVIAVTATEVGNIPAANFLQLLQSKPMVGLALAQVLARRLRQINRRLRQRESDSVARLLDVLIVVAECQGRPCGNEVVISRVPHRELSTLSGLARETVTRTLKRLERQGVIRRQGDAIHLLDISRIEELLV